MKILHIITNTELGGAQKVCIDLCRSAVNDGHNVGVASMDGGYLWEQLPKNVSQFKLKHLVKPISPWKDFLTFFELRKVVKKFKPDIIHLHSSKAGVLGRLVSIFNHKRIVYTVHGFDSIRLKHRVFLPLEKILQKFCGAIVGVSDYDKKNLISEKITRNVFTVYNGIAENTITPEYSLPNFEKKRKIVLSIARISAPKNIDLFLETAKKLPQYDFVWLGGSPEHSVDELHKMYSVPKNVILFGDVPNASNYINICDLFVLFSNFEGLPMTIIEAMSQKKAIVASNVGGIYELVDSSNGKLIENTVEEAVQAVESVLENDVLRHQMEQKSYEKYQNNFTLEKMWEGYKAIYEGLMK